MTNTGYQTLYLKKEAFQRKDKIDHNNKTNQRITQFDFNQIVQKNYSINNSKLKPIKDNIQKQNNIKNFINTSMQNTYFKDQDKLSSFNFQPDKENKIQQPKEFKLDQKASVNLVQYFKQQKKILPKLNNIQKTNIWQHSRAGKFGNRTKINQDRCLHEEINDYKIYAVFDGHGESGHFVSQYLKDQFQKCFKKSKLDFQNYRDTIHEIFQEVKDNLLNQKFDSEQSGSTVGIIFILIALSVIKQNQCISANLGDSRILVCSAHGDKFTVKQITTDQKPELPEEKQRIESMGGFVHQYRNIYGQSLGPYRVWNSENYPGLAMARSMGDFLYYSIGISNTPEITLYTIMPEDKIMIWISDGVHQYLSNEKIMNIVKPFYQKQQVKQACLQLIQIAKQKWQEQDQYVDDITAVVLFLDQT